MTKFKITMVELQKDGSARTLTQHAVCEDRQQVIEFYGLEEPDILSYKIEEIG